MRYNSDSHINITFLRMKCNPSSLIFNMFYPESLLIFKSFIILYFSSCHFGAPFLGYKCFNELEFPAKSRVGSSMAYQNL